MPDAKSRHKQQCLIHILILNNENPIIGQYGKFTNATKDTIEKSIAHAYTDALLRQGHYPTLTLMKSITFVLLAGIYNLSIGQSSSLGKKSDVGFVDVGKMLTASGPYLEEADTLKLFGQFVGVWDMNATFYAKDGTVTKAKGEWHFGWVLGGRCVQDVLFVSGAQPHQYGTTIRCYDKAIKAWRINWQIPEAGEFVNLIARKRGNKILCEVMGLADGHRIIWSFSEITTHSFTWRDEESRDFGATWQLRQEMKGGKR